MFGAFARHDGLSVDLPPRPIRRFRRASLADSAMVATAAWRWRWRLRREGTDPLVAYVFHPQFWPYVPHLRPQRVVYHLYDLFERQKGWNQRLATLHERLLRDADLVVASSQVILDHVRKTRTEGTALLPNAADFDAFSTGANVGEPEDLRHVPRPRIGYTGTLNDKVDFRLLAELAARRPDWHLVLLGEARALSADSREEFRLLQKAPNVHCLGFKHHNKLPHYVARMDVNVMSYRVGDDVWTEAGFPLKLFEYLATGVPVVSADLPSVRPFAHVVQIATPQAESWEQSIESALASGGIGAPVERQSVARENTWDQRVEVLNGLLTSMFAK